MKVDANAHPALRRIGSVKPFKRKVLDRIKVMGTSRGKGYDKWGNNRREIRRNDRYVMELV